MISSDLRNCKPYALPIQCLPCAGLKEVDIRRMVSHIAKEMTAQHMSVAGMCINEHLIYNVHIHVLCVS